MAVTTTSNLGLHLYEETDKPNVVYHNADMEAIDGAVVNDRALVKTVNLAVTSSESSEQTFTVADVAVGMVVADSKFGSPAAIGGRLVVACGNNSITVTGLVLTATTLTCYLIKTQSTTAQTSIIYRPLSSVTIINSMLADTIGTGTSFSNAVDGIALIASNSSAVETTKYYLAKIAAYIEASADTSGQTRIVDTDHSSIYGGLSFARASANNYGGIFYPVNSIFPFWFRKTDASSYAVRVLI